MSLKIVKRIRNLHLQSFLDKEYLMQNMVVTKPVLCGLFLCVFVDVCKD